MRTPKELAKTSPTIYPCELDTCPKCHSPLIEAHYLNGRKTIQTMRAALTIAYQPKLCLNSDCSPQPIAWPSAAWQRLAPKYCTYGYDVIAQIGWERQKGRSRFADVHASLEAKLQISEPQVRYLFHLKYLPLLACHERQHLDELKALSASRGLLLGLDGLMPEGGEPQLWVIRELQTGWTLRCGWLDRLDEPTFIAFLQPIADLGLTVLATLSDKQNGLMSALQVVFPQAKQSLCQWHYFQNAAEPVAAADEQMKIALRQTVRAEIGDLLRPQTVEKPGVLTTTGLIPSPLPEPTPPASGAGAETTPAPAREREEIVQDLVRRVRYLLTLKGRPPFRLAGIEMFEQLQKARQCADELLAYQSESRLLQLRAGLEHALQVVETDYQDLRQAADWLAQIAAVLDPEGQPPRSGDIVQKAWTECLNQIKAHTKVTPRLQGFAKQISGVSGRYAPGLFHTYDVPGLPRTNNERESEFRDVRRRLLSTTGQVGAVKRLLLREGAWELIPGLNSLPETIEAIAQVEQQEFWQEQRRVQNHRQRFRLHTRSAKQSEAQLKDLVRRWRALPVMSGSP
jgi:hypothetical protein